MKSKPSFFAAPKKLWVSDIANIAGLPAPTVDFEVSSVGPLETARADQLAYMDNPKYLAALAGTAAGVCFIVAKYSSSLPASTLGLIVKNPYESYSKVTAQFFPEALSPRSIFGSLNSLQPQSSMLPLSLLEGSQSIPALSWVRMRG